MPITIFSVGALLSYSILNNALFINDNENRASILLNQTIASSEAKQILENIKSDEILQFASRHYVPDNSRNIVPVAYQPNWLPRGFNSDRKIQNRFINKTDKKQFSIFIDKPKNFNLPDGVYQKENFILIRKTHFHGDQHIPLLYLVILMLNQAKRSLILLEPTTNTIYEKFTLRFTYHYLYNPST